MKLDTLEKLQIIEMEVLRCVHELLKENQITYYLRGGTALGAVKYGGFIPWDDDMDIVIPREDYNRFIFYLKKKKDFEIFTIEHYSYNDKINCYFPRVILKEKVRLELGIQKNVSLGLAVMDIIPIDGLPNNRIKRKLYNIELLFYRMMSASITFKDKDNINRHPLIYKIIFWLINSFKLNKRFTQQSLFEKEDRLFNKVKMSESEISGSILGSLGKKEYMKTEYWGKAEFKSFGDLILPVPKEYDYYLKQMYGSNYLNEEPNDDKRKSHIRWEGSK